MPIADRTAPKNCTIWWQPLQSYNECIFCTMGRFESIICFAQDNDFVSRPHTWHLTTGYCKNHGDSFCNRL